MSDSVSHVGIVKSVDSRETVVEIVSASACSSCHAASLCSAAEAVRKDITVPTDPLHPCHVGEEVEVVLSRSMGMKAVWISYVIPLAILLILVVSLSIVNVHELLAGAAAVGAVALYYLVIYLMRKRLSEGYVFSIRKK